MPDKNKTTESIASGSITLQSIISAYAEMWADVLYHKNLTAHLEKVQCDISYLRTLIQVYDKDDIQLLIQIKNDLINLRETILLKINSDHV